MSSNSSTVKPRLRFVGRKSAKAHDSTPVTDVIKNTNDILVTKNDSKKNQRPTRFVSQIPSDILNDDELNAAISILPSNYNFEIHKCVWHIRKQNAKQVALQMPEGLLIYAPIIADILEQFCNVQSIIMGDVTYGACCIDDFTARALGCDFLIHYAHSCLVPVDVTGIKVLYVFVTIDIDVDHFLGTITHHFPAGSRISMVSTIQFNPTLHLVQKQLANYGITVLAPQLMPLSKGEVLGCTSARLKKHDNPEQDDSWDAIVYLGDGRFHLESAMIHNPEIPAYKYDPYSRKFTIEEYDFKELDEIRREAVDQARGGKKVGLILGSLGRQGNPVTLNMLYQKLRESNKEVFTVVLSEIFPGKLALFQDVDFWVQVACPRLSIDWGYAFPKPLLTPYEAMVALEQDQDWKKLGYYPMDYYGKEGYGRGKIPSRNI